MVLESSYGVGEIQLVWHPLSVILINGSVK